MVSGSDEHGTPITVSAEQKVYLHKKLWTSLQNQQSSLLTWAVLGTYNDSRGQNMVVLFQSTTHPRHKEIVQENFLN